MGCGGSKVDDLPLVIRCRERKDLVKSASDYRYALAAAHVSYFHSLKHVGDALHRFVDEELIVNAVASTSSPDSPVLTLPSREGKSKSKSNSGHHKSKNLNLSPSTSSSISHSLDSHDHSSHGHGQRSKSRKKDEIEDSHLDLSISGDSDSGHIHFHDEDDEEVKGEEVPKPRSIYNETDIPSTSYGYNNGYNSYYYPPPQDNWAYSSYNPEENPNPYQFPYPFNYGNSNPNPNMYYMRTSATPANTVVYDDPSVTGYFGSQPRAASPEKPAAPPPPPSPPRVSTWDFFNVFDTYDPSSNAYPGYYPNGRYGFGYGSNTSSPDSKEVREREGIPDLEDETEQEVVKEVYKEKRKVEEEEEVTSNGRNKSSDENHETKRNYEEGTAKSAVPPVRSSSDSISIESIKGKGIKSSVSPDVYHSPDSIVSKSTEEEVTKRKVVSFEVEDESEIPMDVDSSKPSNVTTLSAHGTRDLEDVVKEIKDEFETAYGYGKEVALMLEVDKLPYQRRSTGLKVIVSWIMYMVTSHPTPRSSVQIPSTVMKMAKAYTGDVRTGFDFEFTNISVTLDKLYVWEKKLYKEVKEEERLRVMYEERCKKLRRLDDRGAESSKIEATQASIRKLLTKINVCIRTISVISSKIHRIRDEELQPQIAELFKGLIRMWRSMLRCHQKQFQAIKESKVQSLKANTGLRRDSGLKATVELELELINWCTRFNNWISSQKLYIESLNEWLIRCLDNKPEETADGIAPFSPGRIGAPPIFVVCNDWYQAMVRISEKDVENAMLGFASNLHQLWERQSEEQHQRIKAEYITKDFEKQLRAMRTERGRKEQEQDAVSDKTLSRESGVSPLDDLKVDLDSLKKKLQEERARHKEAAKLVHDAASSSIKGGLVPIFEALGNFTSEVVKAHEKVRLQSTGVSK